MKSNIFYIIFNIYIYLHIINIILINYNFRNIHDKTKLQSTSECEQIQSDDNNDLVIFDKSKNVNLQHIKLNCQMENVISDQSNSQIIIDDEITSASNTTLDIHLKQDIKNSSNSQIIETENEDLSQFIGDVSLFI